MKALRLPLLLVVPAVFILGREPNAAAVSDEIPAAVLQTLETAGPTLQVAGKPVEIEAVRTFYQQRENQPIWVDGAGTSARGQALLRAFQNAARDGLDPADYDPGPSSSKPAAPNSSRRRNWRAPTWFAMPRPPRRPRVADDVLSGISESCPPDPVQVLTAAADAPDPTAFVDSLTPADSIYLELRQTLARYRALAAAGGWPQLPDGRSSARGRPTRAWGPCACASSSPAIWPPKRKGIRRADTTTTFTRQCAGFRNGMACRPKASSTSTPEPCSTSRWKTASGRSLPTWKGRAGCPTISATRTSSSTSRTSLCKSSRAAAMSSKCASSSESRRRSAPYSATRSATSRSTRTGTCHGASPSRRCCVSRGAIPARSRRRIFACSLRRRGDQSGERQLVGGQRQQLQLPPAPGSRGAKRARPYQVHVPDPYGVYLHDTFAGIIPAAGPRVLARMHLDREADRARHLFAAGR